MTKIFKNGIDIKWIVVLFIGLVLGIGVVQAYPILGDPDSYFGNIHGNGGNISNLPASQIVGNFTQRINFSNKIYATGLTSTSGSDEAICKDATTNEYTVNIGLTSCAASTKKIKENIQTLTQSETSPEKFNALRPVKFNFKGESKESIGLIAEEVALIYPQVVGRDKEGNIRGINYEQFIPILIEKLQEQQNININQQNEINILKYEIEQLKGNTGAIAPTPIPIIVSNPAWYEFWK